MWLESLFKAIAEGLGLARQSTDPEVIRLAKLRDIDARLANERNRRDKLMSTAITPENEKQVGADLGIVFTNISRMRQDRRAYER